MMASGVVRLVTDAVMGNSSTDGVGKAYGPMGAVGIALMLGVPLIFWIVGYKFSQSILSITSKEGKLVAPGSSWLLPVVGETFQMIVLYDGFLRSRIKRFGEIFSTHLYFAPTVVVANTEAISQVIASPDHKYFQPTLPTAYKEMFGPDSLVNIPTGTPVHTHIRRLYNQRVRGAGLAKLIPDIDNFMKNTLESWADQGTVRVYPKARKVAFCVGLRVVLQDEAVAPGTADAEAFRIEYHKVMTAAFSLPINLPGFAYYKGLKGREYILRVVEKVIQKRQKAVAEDKTVVYDDLLGDLLTTSYPDLTKPGEEERNVPLTPTEIRDNFLFAMLAAHDTTACVITWLLTYLASCPKDVEIMIKEHQAIADSKGSKDYTLQHEDLAKMPHTLRAFRETSRMANPSFGLLRMAHEDVHLKGKFVPKGWRVLLAFAPTHYNDKHYSDAAQFNPSRFEKQTPYGPTHLTFSRGPRMCPGFEFAEAESMIFLHRFLLNYKWELLGSPEIGIRFPLPVPKDELPIRITRK